MHLFKSPVIKKKIELTGVFMLNPVQAFDYVNSAIQSNTGYSFSQLAKNVNKIAFPAIVLAGMYMVSAKEDFGTCPRDPEDYSRFTCSNYDDCITFCLEKASQYGESFIAEFDKCAQVLCRTLPNLSLLIKDSSF